MMRGKSFLVFLPLFFLFWFLLQPRAYGQEIPPECEALVQRSRTLYRFQHPDSLRARVEAARKARACVGDRHVELAGFLYLDEINALTPLGRTGEALARYDEYFARFGARADTLWRCAMHHRRGYLHYTQGHYGRALSDYARAVAYAASLRPLREASLTLDLGVLYAFVRDYESARHLFEKADSLISSFTPEAAHETADSQGIRARLLASRAHLTLIRFVYAGEGNAETLREAVRQYETAAAQLATLDAPERLARIHLQLAELHAYLGEATTARGHLARANRLAASRNDPALDHIVAHKTGLVELALGEEAPAERALQQALARAASLPPTQAVAATHTLAGLLAEQQGDRWSAIAHYERAAEITERLRAELGTTELSLAAFADWQEPYRGLVRAYLAAGRPEEAFMALERTRARHLLDVRGEMEALHTADEATRARHDSLTTVIATLRADLRHVRSPAREAELRRRLTLAQFERSALLPASSTLTPADPAALRARLAGENRVLLSYYIDRGDRLLGRPARSAVFVLTPDTLVAVPLDAPEDRLQALLARVSPIMTGETTVSLNRLHFDNGALHDLYRVLMAPVAAWIPPGKRLTILPDGPLHMLPFGLLVEEPGVPRFAYREAPYLFKKHPISVEIAVALLPDAAPLPETPVEVLALGKTRYNSEAIRAWFRASGLQAGPVPNLPGVREEVEALTRLFSRVRTLLDEEATEAAFFSQEATPRVLHLASHVIIHPRSPLYNALFLSPDPADPAYDGVVYLYELNQSRLRPHLVTLSGCSTARGLVQPGEGMAGLQQTFREMGVPSSVATLWLADDEATARLMEAFYRHLRDGQPKDVALQQAQIEFLENAPKNSVSPFFWAAPALFGNLDPLPLTPRRRALLPWLLLFFACVLPVSVYILRRRRFTPPLRPA